MGLLKEEKVKLKESWFAYYTVVVPIGVLMDWIDWTVLKMIKTSSCLWMRKQEEEINKFECSEHALVSFVVGQILHKVVQKWER